MENTLSKNHFIITIDGEEFMIDNLRLDSYSETEGTMNIVCDVYKQKGGKVTDEENEKITKFFQDELTKRIKEVMS